MAQQSICPCGSAQDYAHCCEPFLNNAALPASAEQLMRSRYTAYVLHNTDYLLATWHVSTRPASLELTTATKWLGLKLVATRAGGPKDTEGSVEFIARYKIHGKAHRLHETSRFIRQQDRWFYVAGEIEG